MLSDVGVCVQIYTFHIPPLLTLGGNAALKARILVTKYPEVLFSKDSELK